MGRANFLRRLKFVYFLLCRNDGGLKGPCGLCPLAVVIHVAFVHCYGGRQMVFEEASCKAGDGGKFLTACKGMKC